MKTETKKSRKLKFTFAKVSAFSMLIFAITFACWLNFAPKNLENAHAENSQNSENSAETVQNTETSSAQISANQTEISVSENENSENFTVKQLDFINFDGASYINTGENQLGDISARVDFEFSDPIGTTNSLFLFGARSTQFSDAFYSASDNMSQHFGWPVDSIKFTYGDSPNVANGICALANSNCVHPAPYDNARHQIEIDNNSVSMENSTLTVNAPAPTVAHEIFLGGLNDNGAPNSRLFAGKIYAFQIKKFGILVRNLIPAARFLCDSGEVEYGFANDLDNDGDFANDEWFSNSGDGTLTGSEEIAAEECAEKPSENEKNPDENNENSAQESDNNSAKILPPNAGIFAK